MPPLTDIRVFLGETPPGVRHAGRPALGTIAHRNQEA